MVVEVNWLTLYQECRRAVFWPVVAPPEDFGGFFHSGKEADGYADDFSLMAVVPSPGVTVSVAESLIRDLVRVS